MKEIKKASPKARVKMYVLVSISFAILLLFKILIFPKIEGLIRIDKINEALLYIKSSLVFVFLSIIPFAITMMLNAFKIFKSEQFPFPGQQVLKDTKIEYGSKAKYKGIMLLIAAFILVASSIYGIVFSFNVIDGLIVNTITY